MNADTPTRGGNALEPPAVLARGDCSPEPEEEVVVREDDPPEPPEVLAEAGVEALAELFPEWRIWADCSGWHAARRGEFVQDYHDGAPAFYVHARSASGLAGQLRWQQAAQVHAPFGCSRSGRTD
jgi:hypothetical protein